MYWYVLTFDMCRYCHIGIVCVDTNLIGISPYVSMCIGMYYLYWYVCICIVCNGQYW